MGENKKLRKKIKSWLERIEEHEAKIAAEQAKSSSNQGLIEKWRQEIRTFEANIVKAAKRLPGGRL